MSSFNEIDIDAVLRPEVILDQSFSAIFVPAIVERDKQRFGEWIVYLQGDNGRECFTLSEPQLQVSNRRILLSPVPGEPRRQDVARLCRWSKQSRIGWIEGRKATSTYDLFKRISARLHRYIYLPPERQKGDLTTLALWVMLTYLYRALQAVPYVYLSGPLGSGKTRTMEVLAQLCWRPMMASSLTGPTLFRMRHAEGGTLFLDEAEQMKERSPRIDELRQILLAGYKRNGSATRLEPKGDTYLPVSFDVYGPSVLACINGLPPALASRCIAIGMMRAPTGTTQTEESIDDKPDELRLILDDLHCWAMQYGWEIVNAELPCNELTNRNRELWRPLLQIANHTGNSDLLDLVLDHAKATISKSAEDQVPVRDELCVQALYKLRANNIFPTPGQIAEEVMKSSEEHLSPRAVSNVLRNYSLVVRKSNNKRTYNVNVEGIKRVALSYGFTLEEDDEQASG